MANKQTPPPSKQSSTMGLKGGSTSNLSSHGKTMALPTGANTLGLKGGTQGSAKGHVNPSVSIPVGVVAGQTSSKS
jgi:hypothetical protein